MRACRNFAVVILIALSNPAVRWETHAAHGGGITNAASSKIRHRRTRSLIDDSTGVDDIGGIGEIGVGSFDASDLGDQYSALQAAQPLPVVSSVQQLQQVPVYANVQTVQHVPFVSSVQQQPFLGAGAGVGGLAGGGAAIGGLAGAGFGGGFKRYRVTHTIRARGFGGGLGGFGGLGGLGGLGGIGGLGGRYKERYSSGFSGGFAGAGGVAGAGLLGGGGIAGGEILG